MPTMNSQESAGLKYNWAVTAMTTDLHWFAKPTEAECTHYLRYKQVKVSILFCRTRSRKQLHGRDQLMTLPRLRKQRMRSDKSMSFTDKSVQEAGPVQMKMGGEKFNERIVSQMHRAWEPSRWSDVDQKFKPSSNFCHIGSTSVMKMVEREISEIS